MGSGNWFKTVIRRNKGKDRKSKKSKGISSYEKSNGSVSADSPNVNGSGNNKDSSLREEKAAIRIQTAFRAYKARKVLLRIKGAVRLQKLTQRDRIKKQSSSVLTHLHTWSRIQAEIRERRLSMVTEGRIKQKKLENQLKLEAKLHDLEVEWCSGSETMEEALARIHQREEAAVKRERTLAYAFSHQWRASSNQSQGINASELIKASCGWSWKERWIAARPWESRISSESISPKSSKKLQNKSLSKASSKNTTPPSSQKSLPPIPTSMNGKGPTRPRRLSFPSGDTPDGEANKGKETNTGSGVVP